jgi:cell division control protein 6
MSFGLGSRSILILDEIDHMVASSQMLESLFALAQKHSSSLHIIGIAKIQALTSSVYPTSLDSVTGASTLHFQLMIYSSSFLSYNCISNSLPLSKARPPRRSFSNFFPSQPSLFFLGTFAAHAGDVRSLSEVLRSAIDLAVTQAPSSDKDTPLVTPAHILVIFKSHLLKSRRIIEVSDEWEPCDNKSGRIITISSVFLMQSTFSLLLLTKG